MSSILDVTKFLDLLCNLERENSYKLLRIWKILFWTSYHGFQDHHMDQWKTFTFPSTKTSVHGGMYTSRLACLWSLAVFYLYPSNTIWQILYFGDTYLRYLFITSLNVVPDENTWRSKAPQSITTSTPQGITLINNWSSFVVLSASSSMSTSFKFLFCPLWCDCFVFRTSSNTEFLGCLMKWSLRARSLVVSDLRLKTKGSWFEPGCYLCAEVSSLQ